MAQFLALTECITLNFIDMIVVAMPNKKKMPLTDCYSFASHLNNFRWLWFLCFWDKHKIHIISYYLERSIHFKQNQNRNVCSGAKWHKNGSENGFSCTTSSIFRPLAWSTDNDKLKIDFYPHNLPSISLLTQYRCLAYNYLTLWPTLCTSTYQQ